MKIFFKLFFFLFFIGILLVPVVLCIDKTPSVIHEIPLSQKNIQRITDIVQKHRPDVIKKKQGKVLTLSGADLNLLLEYGISKGLNSRSLAARVTEKNGQLALSTLEIGRMSIPGSIVSPLLAGLHRLFLRRIKPGKNRGYCRCIQSDRFGNTTPS